MKASATAAKAESAPMHGTIHRHFKNKSLYLLCDIIRNAEGDPMALYYSFEKKELFTRPLEEFYGKVEVDGKKVDRFALVEAKS